MHYNSDSLDLNKKLARASINNKSVIFVGPATSLEGKRQGGIIDKYDLVVRTNGGFRLADRYPEDYGSKCDILYINNFWYRKHISGCTQQTQTRTFKRLLQGDIKFIILKAPSAKKLPTWLLKLNKPKFFVGRRISPRSDLRKLWKVDNTLTEPMQATHAIYNLLQFKAKTIAVTGIDFYEGLTSWHKFYNTSEVNEEEHRKSRELQHSLVGDKKFIKACLKKNWIKADTKIRQLLHLEDLDAKFETPRL